MYKVNSIELPHLHSWINLCPFSNMTEGSEFHLEAEVEGITYFSYRLAGVLLVHERSVLQLIIAPNRSDKRELKCRQSVKICGLSFILFQTNM